MSEILQSQSIVKLYEYEYNNFDLDDAIVHYGVKGMKWGIRKDRRRGLSKLWRRRKKKKTYKDPQDALAAKDVKYVNANKSKYSTKEINTMLNRIDAERRLSEIANKSPVKSKVKKVLNSKTFKVASGVAVGALAFAAYQYIHDATVGIDGKMLIGERDIGKAAVDLGKQAASNAKYDLVPFMKYFRGVK